MIVYHGSFMPVEFPDVLHSRKDVDFGAGFYVTLIRSQADNWAKKFIRKGNDAFVSSYNFDDDVLSELSVLKFDSYSEEWLNFILSARTGNDTSSFEVVIGGVANDKVYNTLELFFDDLITKSEALGRLKYEKPNNQICFRSQKAIDLCLTYIKSECVNSKFLGE